MKKKKMLSFLGTVVLVVALTGGMLTGCGTPDQEPELENGAEPGNDLPDETDGIVTYTVIDDGMKSSLPQAMLDDLELLKKQRGYFVFTPSDYDTGDAIYLMVSAGEKPTGGFSLSLVSLEKENGTLNIQLEEKEPAEDEMVIQVLTYPNLVIKLEQTYASYKITDTDNGHFPELTAADIPERREAQGTFNGQIDSNFIEISVDGNPGAYMLPTDLSWVLAELLNSGDEVVFTYIENEHGQRIIKELDTKERAAMIRGVQGVLVGLIDSHSVEIEVEGKPKAYGLAEQINLSSLNEGDRVVFDYYEDQHGRMIINRMEGDRR